MALGRKNKAISGKLLILKIKTKDADDKPISPVFEISEKGADNKYVKRTQTETGVSGNLVRLEVKEQKWKDETYNTVALFLQDGDETYLVDCRVNMLTRSLFNSLLSLKKFENVSISLYMYKKTDKNTGAVSEYPAVSLWQNDEQVKWAVPIAEQPKPTSVVFKGKKQNDYTAVDLFFIEKLRGLAKVVDAAAKSSGSQIPDEPQAENTEVDPTRAKLDEDVPF